MIALYELFKPRERARESNALKIFILGVSSALPVRFAMMVMVEHSSPTKSATSLRPILVNARIPGTHTINSSRSSLK